MVIERAGKPMGVVIPVERYAQIAADREQARERFFATIDEIHEQNKDLDPEEVERVVAEEIAAFRRERREARATEDQAVEPEPLATA